MFPLYTQLYKDIDTEPITDNDIDFFISNIEQISDKEHEIIFALIRMHQVEQNCTNLFIIPYGGKHQKKGIKFDFNSLPEDLQKILVRFMKLHCKIEKII